jgi:PAS domain S-box-containing protein
VYIIGQLNFLEGYARVPFNKILLDKLKNNDPDLLEIDCSYQKITFEDLLELVAALSSNTQLKLLNISGNPISNPGFELLTSHIVPFTTLLAADCNITSIEKFNKNTNLLVLDLASNEIDAKSAALLADSNLQTLSLAGNDSNDDVARALANSTHLINLTLSHNKIGIQGALAFEKNLSIKKLILNKNNIQSAGAEALANNQIITTLNVAANNIDKNGIIALSYNNSTLLSLDVSYNFVNDEAFAALGTHASLVELNVGYNQITFKGAQDFVANNTRLRTLIICHNLLRDPGAIALLKHPSITVLDMAGNAIGFPGGYAVFLNKTVKVLTLSTNNLGNSGGVIVAQNQTLTELFLSYNGIGDDAALIFATNKTLKKLNLNYNIITETGRAFLEDNKDIQLSLSKEQPPEFTNENLDTIFKLSESFLCISDTEGILQFFNPAFSRTLGYGSDTLLAKSAYDFLHPDDKAAQKHRGDEVTPIHYYENRYRCADGSYRNFQWTSKIQNKRRYAVGADVTEHREAEKAARLALQRNHLYLLAETKDHIDLQTNFISQLSHEIRNPLSGISGLLDICVQQILDLESLIKIVNTITALEFRNRLSADVRDIKEDLLSMIICAEYATAILNDNLDIVKISDKNFKLEKYIFDLKKVPSNVISMLNKKATNKGVPIYYHAPEEKEIWVKGDALRIKQILINLLSNAIKFTEKGAIDITLVVLEKTIELIRIQITVKDTGKGLTPDEKNRLFGRFIQANHNIESQYGGSGLGLFVAKQKALAMHGDITVTSEEHVGSSFNVIIELDNLSLEEIATCEEIEEKKDEFSPLGSPTQLGIFSAKAVPSKKLLILIVDDNNINRKILIRMVSSAGHSFLEAANGQEAINAYVKNKKIDLILMDVIMPVKSGIEATIEIRQLEEKLGTKPVKIFGITANALIEAHADGLAAGMDRYFTKPIVAKDLLGALDELATPLPELEFARGHTC